MAIGKEAKELLCSIIKNKDQKTLAFLKESQFVSADEQKAFKSLRRHVSRHGKFPGKFVVRNALKLPYIVTREPVSYYVENFINRAKYNLIRNSYGDLSEAMQSRDVETAERLIETISLGIKSMRVGVEGSTQSFDVIAQKVIEDYNAARFSGGIRGITCGWPEIDNETGGWQEGDVITLAARLGRGKTYLLLFQAFAAAMAGRKVLFVSPEVPDVQLVRRMIGILTGINPRYIARGQLSTDIFRGMVQTIDGIRGQLPIEFAAGRFKKTMPFVNAMTEELEPDIIFIDAAYLVTPEKRRASSGGRREVISDVAEEIKDAAANFNRPYNISVQLNRTAVKSEKTDESSRRTKKNPLAHLDVHKLAETDVIAQISSIVMVAELGDPPFAARQRYLGIKKGREGEQGYWKIRYEFNPFNFSVMDSGNENQTANYSIDEEDLDEEID